MPCRGSCQGLSTGGLCWTGGLVSVEGRDSAPVTLPLTLTSVRLFLRDLAANLSALLVCSRVDRAYCV